MALAAAFALHAQGVKDPDNNKATKGQTLYFYGEPDYFQWKAWGRGEYYNWNDESCWYTDRITKNRLEEFPPQRIRSSSFQVPLA